MKYIYTSILVSGVSALIRFSYAGWRVVVLAVQGLRIDDTEQLWWDRESGDRGGTVTLQSHHRQHLTITQPLKQCCHELFKLFNYSNSWDQIVVFGIHICILFLNYLNSNIQIVLFDIPTFSKSEYIQYLNISQTPNTKYIFSI